ncbi:MAG: glycosyl transferase [Candidatus Roseilinea sp.]|nr:MAG: glycosyl transferase [Candidatus Roseilinea sp.]
MQTLAVTIIAKNEADNIVECLESVTWANEIVVADSGSTDETCAIARRYTDKVFFHEWTGYADQRNFADSLVTTDWILALDADERVSEALRNEIQRMLSKSANDQTFQAFRIPIKDWMFGKFVNYGSWPHQRPIRLYRAGCATWRGAVHESLHLRGAIGDLYSPILHYSHTSIRKFLDKLNTYTEIEAEEMFKAGRRVRLSHALAGALRAFLGQYVRLQGFRDGGHGLILAILMATYYFITRAKLWSYWYLQDHGKVS